MVAPLRKVKDWWQRAVLDPPAFLERRRVRRAAVDALQEAIDVKLAASPLADVSAEAKRAEDLRQSIANIPSNKRREFVSGFLVAAGCVFLIWLGLTWRVSTIELSFSLNADAVELTTSGLWQTPGVLRIAGSLGASGVAEARVQSSTQPAVFVDPGPLLITSPHIDLILPDIPAGTRLRIACLVDDTIEFSFVGSPMDVVVRTDADAAILGEGSPGTPNVLGTATFGAEDSLRFRSEQDRPFVVSMPAQAAANTPLFGAVARIRFPAEVLAGGTDRAFTSAITSGELQVATSQTSRTLDRYDELSMDGVAGAAVIQVSKSCLSVLFEGQAESAELGKGVTKHDLAPSQLSFWYQEQRLPFYLTVFGVLWGVAWGGLKWLRR